MYSAPYQQQGAPAYQQQQAGQMVNYYSNNANVAAPTALCYQVDFNAVATGKVIAMSKRRIRWRFGFPNQAAVDAGQAGIDCRGEEHDVTLVWSITSGKRMLMSNGQQIYVGINKGKIFEHSWSNKNGNNMRVIAHSTQPLSNTQGSRQYDLFVDGKSFFVLPKVYEVGLKGSSSDVRIPGIISSMERGRLEQQAPARRVAAYSESGRNIVAPHSAEQEQDELKKAIEASLNESRAHLQAKGRLNEEESLAASTLTATIGEHPKRIHQIQQAPEPPLIDFFSDPNPAAASYSQALVPVGAPQTQYQLDDPFGFNTQPAYNAAPSMAPPAPRVDEFAPQAPSYNDISSQILMGYSPHPAGASPPGPPPPAPPAAYNPFDDGPAPAPTPSYASADGYPYQQPQQQQQNPYQQQQQAAPTDMYGAPVYQQQPPQQQSYGNYQM
jgi:hypothetical protein